MSTFQVTRSKLKLGFGILALVLLIGLPFLGPYVSKLHEEWNIPLNRMQLFYAVLSSEIVLAVYIWGVGNWSRFEPPPSAANPSIPTNTDPPAQPPVAAPQHCGN